jgi:Putative DNA-binding domain
MPMIAKALADVTRDDLSQLILSPWIEDEQIDFKVTIPHRDGDGRDPWRNAATPEARRIKDHGRDQLLAALVAFANSYGGDLVIGVREIPGTQPGVAEALDPLPACEDAAQRLAQAAMACIEPPLTSLQVRGIPLEEDGSGVVILRTPRSRMAPHRLTTNKECYHRVRHDTLPMTMRQMQDLTFSVARGLEAVEQRFAAASHLFKEFAQTVNRPPETHRIGLRVTAIPLSELYIERVHNVAAIQPSLRNARLRLQPAPPDYGLTPPFNVHLWRAALRGTEAYQQNDESHARVGVYCDGTIRYEWVRDTRLDGQGRRYLIYPGWYLAVAVNAVESSDRFRTVAGAAAVEYALEIELIASRALPVMRFGDNWFDPAGQYPPGSTPFPRYVVGPPATFQETYTQIYRDFWNAIGIDAHEDQFLLDA